MTGIEVHKYGAHLFHTGSQEVVDYLSRFTDWTLRARVWTTAGGRVYPMPINLATICLFTGKLMSPDEARAWVASRAGGRWRIPAEPRGQAMGLVGRPLYEAFIRGYPGAVAERILGSCRPRLSRGCPCARASTTVISMTRSR